MKSPTALHTLVSPGRERASYGFDRGSQEVRRRGRPAQALRGAIDCMPIETRTAMRDALEAEPIIVGAYTDRDGGVCPMLAAHRNGGRTSFAAFARAWDRYTRAGDVPRRASERELRALAAMLDASIAMHEVVHEPDLGAAIAEHRGARRRVRSSDLEDPYYGDSPGRVIRASGTRREGEVLTREHAHRAMSPV